MKKGSSKKKFFKNKYQMIICLLLFILFIYGFIYLGRMDFSKHEEVNNINNEEKFVLDNIFVSVNSTDAYNIIKNKNVIILFGTASKWVSYYADVLADSAKELNINSIYYYDIEKDRQSKNATYESVVNYLENEIYSVEGIKMDLYAPTLLIKKKNQVLLFDDSSAIMKGTYEPEEYWDEYNISRKRLLFEAALKDYME